MTTLATTSGSTTCMLQNAGSDYGTAGSATKIFKLHGAGSLQGSDAAEALVEGINDANVDDTYTKLQFLVEDPVIRIDPIGDKHVGDKFTITATDQPRGRRRSPRPGLLIIIQADSEEPERRVQRRNRNR